MEWKNYNIDMENNILMKIKEGMKVYDSQDREIGKGDDVFLGAVSPKDEEVGEGPATIGTVAPGPMNQTQNPMIPGQLQNIDEDAMPNFAFGGAVNPTNAGESDKDRILEERMRQEGYMKIDSGGLFNKDVIVMADQIESVREDSVRLKVPKKELVTR